MNHTEETIGGGSRWRDFTRIYYGREIVALATPIILTMLSQTLMWTVDTIFLGRFSSLALAAAGLGGILSWTAYSLFNNLSRINATFVSQAHGRGDDETVGHYTWQALWLATLTGTLLAILGWNSHHFLHLTGNPPEVVAQAYVYIKWRTLSAAFTQYVFALMGYCQGRRDVRTPMWAGIAANAVNAVLDLWLIFGWSGLAVGGLHLFAMPALGVKGAAIATSLSTALNAVFIAAPVLLSAEQRRRYRIHAPRPPHPRSLWRMIRVGLPSSVGNFVDMSSFAAFTAMIGRGGAHQLAASQITLQLLSFSFMPMWGLTSAGSVLVGNWIGAGVPATAARYGRQVYKLGLLYSLLLALLYVLLGGGIFRIFTQDPAVLVYAGALVLAAATFQFGDALRMIGSGLLTGAGDTRLVLVATVATMWGCFLPLTWWLVVRNDGDVTTAWLGGAASYFAMGIVFWFRFRSGAWQRISIFE